MERKNDSKLLKICAAAMLAALVCIATMIIRIPSPLGGYINFGDIFVLLGGWVMGPIYGFAVGGIGSALADLFSGYAVYMPGTFIIKGLTAASAAIIFHRLSKKEGTILKISRIISALAGEIIMIAGYYLYAAIPMGEGFTVALQSLPGNAIQGVFGIVGGMIICTAIEKTRLLSKINMKCI